MFKSDALSKIKPYKNDAAKKKDPCKSDDQHSDGNLSDRT